METSSSQSSPVSGSPTKKILIGLALLVASLLLLVWNEGKADLSAIANTAKEISADAPADASMQGQLVSVSGPIVSEELLGDGQYLKPGPYLAIERHVEMYAWAESSQTSSEGNKTYSYNKVWTANPVGPVLFKEPVGHENPSLTIPDATFKATSAKVGNYFVDVASATLPIKDDLAASADTIAFLPGVQIADSSYVYIGRGTSFSPYLGDLRVKYRVLRNNANVTVFGALQGSRLTSFEDPITKTNFYRVALGNKSQALKAIATEQVLVTWIARLAGLLLMWGGLVILLQRFAAMELAKARIVSIVVSAGVTAGIVLLF